jgi:hypothetical protein
MIATGHREWFWRFITALNWCLCIGCVLMGAVELVRMGAR